MNDATVPTAAELLGRLAQALGAARPAVLALAPLAEAEGGRLWWVGGSLRDALGSGDLVDVDLMVEGSAPALVARAVATLGGVAGTPTAFGTVTWQPPAGPPLDLASARSETYAAPGALPKVALGAPLAADLARRDFSVNAMAVALGGPAAGALVDPHGGWRDLQAGELRVLHPESFLDDPTRIWRAARLGVRLGMRLAPASRAPLRAALAAGAPAAVSLERHGAELQRALNEPVAAAVLRRARALGVLAAALPTLAAAGIDRSLARGLRMAESLPKAVASLAVAPEPLRWLLLACALPAAARRASLRLLPSRAGIELWRSGPEALAQAEAALMAAASPAAVGRALRPLSPVLLAAAWLQWRTKRPRRALAWWLDAGRAIRPAVDGHALAAAGHKPGPAFQVALDAAYDAALGGADRQAQWAAAVAALGGARA